jgi:hypothetical protein
MLNNYLSRAVLPFSAVATSTHGLRASLSQETDISSQKRSGHVRVLLKSLPAWSAVLS